MVVVMVRCHVKPGCEEAFAAASIANARASNLEPGVLRFDFYREEDPSRFILLEAYRDEEGPRSHKASAHYAAWRDAVEPLLAEERSRERLEGLFVPERRL